MKKGFTDTYPGGEYIYKTVYTHTSDVLISYIYYSVDPDTKVEIKSSEGSLTYKNGNIVKQQQTVMSNTETRVYEYDIKNNPLKNILGFSLLLDEISNFGINNDLKKIRTSSNFPNPVTYNSDYIYNDKSYPLQQTSFTGGGSIEYEIEYTY